MIRFSILELPIIFLLVGCALIQSPNAEAPKVTKAISSTATVTLSIQPSMTPTRVSEPSATKVISTVQVVTPVATQAVPASDINTDSRAVSDGPKYVLQSGSPRWLTNFVHPQLGCNYLGVAGQVFDLDGTPATMLVVEAGGNIAGQDVLALSLTGLVSAFGPGGYEIMVSDQAVESTDSVWVQVLNLKGEKISERIYFDTFADCQRNLVLINLVESGFSGEKTTLYFPHIFRNPFDPGGTDAPER